MLFQSTPSARRATPQGRTCNLPCRISIHALREEGDFPAGSEQRRKLAISIHALREEGDAQGVSSYFQQGAFQSTPSARRATVLSHCVPLRDKNFNPRPPRGERPRRSPRSSSLTRFQSTPSARRATKAGGVSAIPFQNFNPRPPRGERRVHRLHSRGTQQFQSTPSARRATWDGIVPGDITVKFQSTPSARRATHLATERPRSVCNFNPRPPRGERQLYLRKPLEGY